MAQMISVCGADCGACNFLSQCTGCSKIEGKAPYLGGAVCPIYACSQTKETKNCAACDIKKCKIYMGHRDPSLTDEQFEAWVNVKIDNLKKTF